MKSLSIALIPFVLFISCSNDAELKPDIAPDVTGEYQATYAHINKTALSLPKSNAKIDLRLDKVDINTVDCKLITNINGMKTETSDNLDIENSSDKVRLLISGKQFGYIKNNELIIDYVNKNGSKVLIKANKKRNNLN